MEAPYKKIMIASDTDTTVINIFKDLQKADLDTFINFDFIPNKKVWISYKNKLDEKQLDPTERLIMTMYIKLFSFNGFGRGYKYCLSSCPRIYLPTLRGTTLDHLIT